MLVIITTSITITWYNGHDDHVEHVVKEQSNADGDQDKLSLVLWLLLAIRKMKRMIRDTE